MEPIAQTRSGAVRGRTDDGITVFRGIPYAAPLDGIRRFQAPQPPQRWDGVRDALAFSADPPQGTRLPGTPPMWQPGDSADCLSVNVWTPDPGGSGLPVMVWIYGGAFLMGTSRDAGYDGTNLARDGVVVVTLNYRVGLEGFGWLPGAPPNRAHLDQLAALRWVQDNIANFGGDPGLVTVFGESAGATSVAVLTAADAGRGLFRRAIAQSVGGSCLPEARLRATTERIAQALGVPATAEAFAAVPPEAVHGVQLVPGQITPYGPMLDGDLVRDAPWAGLRAEVDLISGYNRDEYRLFALDVDPAVKDPARTPRRVPVAEYRAAYPDLPDPELYTVIMSDVIFRMPSMRCVEHHPGRSFCYELTWPSPALDGVLGACHGLDVPLTFGNFDGTLTARVLGPPVPPEAKALSRQIRTAWTSFAATGDPGWPEYRVADRLTRIWDVPVSVAADPESVSRKIWANLP